MADDAAPPATWTRPVLRPWHWLLIACIDIIGPFSTDSYIPNLPEMARELDAPTWLAGLTLQANWLAKGVGTLAIGPLSDSPRVGRRVVLRGGAGAVALRYRETRPWISAQPRPRSRRPSRHNLGGAPACSM